MKMIQIRNVPDDLHRKLKARAARSGITLSEMLLREARLLADEPTPEELIARIRSRPAVDPSFDTVALIREVRDRP